MNLIHKQVGTVTNIAKVYKSAAMGFEGDDFLNTCISVSTNYTVDKVLTLVLAIEKKLGRQRQSLSTGYASRPIDIDIIFYDALIVNTKTLQVPHPACANRKFVLQPLSEIAGELKHPVTHISVLKLLENCPDQSLVTPINIWLKNPIKDYQISKCNFLVIEGNIGAGKTTLANQLALDFNGKLILERFADNPFLPKFYNNKKRYAFALEMSFLAERYQQITDDLAQLDLFKDMVISDYDVSKSLIFSKITLEKDEFTLYKRLFDIMYKAIKTPDLYVYLYQNTERLQENIKKRGRSYESDMDNKYLEQINAGYLQFLKNTPQLNVKIIDVSDFDFVENRADYIAVLDQIHQAIYNNIID